MLDYAISQPISEILSTTKMQFITYSNLITSIRHYRLLYLQLESIANYLSSNPILLENNNS
jgi:hypothetical protein